MNYNTYINKLYSINDILSNDNMDEENYISPKDNNYHPSNNILNNIVQHPFIDTLSINLESFFSQR